ncbi:MAG: glycosyltransferase family 4 protein [Bacteroidetes bacterium]|nr:glycosyltransferase family 4 protein [Bacteroidota bacterium]
MNRKPAGRILYIVQHRFNRSGGQRFRCEQYIPFLENAGFECVYSPLLKNEQEDKDFYAAANYFKKFLLFLKAIVRRWKDVRRARQFDIIFIYREALMTGTTIFERLLKKSGAKIVFDFDDAIWNFDVSAGNKTLGWLKRPKKVNEIMALADLVLAGSSHLAGYARQFNSNVHVVPSTLDLDIYTFNKKTLKEDAPVVIGWCGSVTTIKHFEMIIPVYTKLRRKYGSAIAFKVYGLPGYVNRELGIESIRFSPDTEVPVISSFDIGVMPLPDNEWTRGKCGMKGLQCMALGIPVVMQDVGANKEIICEGENGFLANDEDEWTDKLSILIDSEHCRRKLGANGRKTIEKFYSSDAVKTNYVGFFKQLA